MPVSSSISRQALSRRRVPKANCVEPKAACVGHSDWVQGMAGHASHLASASDDGTVRLSKKAEVGTLNLTHPSMGFW